MFSVQATVLKGRGSLLGIPSFLSTLHLPFSGLKASTKSWMLIRAIICDEEA